MSSPANTGKSAWIPSLDVIAVFTALLAVLLIYLGLLPRIPW